jgi:hypothetical protein
MVQKMKMTVFWLVVQCSLVNVTDVSELLTAFIIRADDNVTL